MTVTMINIRPTIQTTKPQINFCTLNLKIKFIYFIIKLLLGPIIIIIKIIVLWLTNERNRGIDKLDNLMANRDCRFQCFRFHDFDKINAWVGQKILLQSKKTNGKTSLHHPVAFCGLLSDKNINKYKL